MSEPLRYTQPDTSDKESDESWTQYWDRKRVERHGADCGCPLCGPRGEQLRERSGHVPGLLSDEEIG